MNVEDLNKLMSGLKGGLDQVMPQGLGTLDEEIETESGGGLVKVVVGTRGGITKISIDPLLLDKENVSHLEQLLIAAVNDGRSKWEEALKRKTISTFLQNPPEGFDLQKAMADALKVLDR